MYKEAYNQRGFRGFNTECLKYMNSFCDLYKISNLRRTGLRYINHISILKEVDGSIPIGRYINLKYDLPHSIPQKFNLFTTTLVVQKGKGKLRILIEYQKLPTPQETEIILLDFDYYLEKDLVADKLAGYLSDSHSRTEEVFLDLITKEYEEAIKGE